MSAGNAGILPACRASSPDRYLSRRKRRNNRSPVGQDRRCDGKRCGAVTARSFSRAGASTTINDINPRQRHRRWFVRCFARANRRTLHTRDAPRHLLSRRRPEHHRHSCPPSGRLARIGIRYEREAHPSIRSPLPRRSSQALRWRKTRSRQKSTPATTLTALGSCFTRENCLPCPSQSGGSILLPQVSEKARGTGHGHQAYPGHAGRAGRSPHFIERPIVPPYTGP